jgi:hypothetical protein
MEKKLNNQIAIIETMILKELDKVLNLPAISENDMKAENIYKYIGELEIWKKETIAKFESIKKFEELRKVARN